ncbi:MAG: ABC transporter ATP-binding protein [Tissierellia bacterium]|nr:ABC transporter ATP-binding protein [Tissierellia bacterium]
MTQIFTLENCSYEYLDGTRALSEIELSIGEGTTAILGANGAGKSSLFLLLLGLNRPSAGRLLVDGRPMDYGKGALRAYHRKVNMVFQDPDKQLFFARVHDDVAFALRNYGFSPREVEERVQEALEFVGLAHLAEKPPHLLSYGQKKRVAIATVLAMEPEVLLFDEPTAGLDPKMVEEMKLLLKDLKDRGKTLILSSHDMDFIYELADEVHVLQRGQLVASGRTQEVFSQGEVLRAAGLKTPFLVRAHQEAGLPLFQREEELLAYWRERLSKEDEKTTR